MFNRNFFDKSPEVYPVYPTKAAEVEKTLFLTVKFQKVKQAKPITNLTEIQL